MSIFNKNTQEEVILKRKPFSEQAAAAAQYVIDLEGETEKINKALSDAKTEIAFMKKQMADLRGQLMMAEEARDHFRARYGDAITRVQVAGKVILDIMESTRPEPYAPTQPALQLEDLKPAVDQKPPEFLSKPKVEPQP